VTHRKGLVDKTTLAGIVLPAPALIAQTSCSTRPKPARMKGWKELLIPDFNVYNIPVGRAKL